MVTRHTPRTGWQDKVAFDLADKLPRPTFELVESRLDETVAAILASKDAVLEVEEPYAVEDVMKNFTSSTVEVNTPYGKLYGPSEALDYVAELIQHERIRKEIGPQLQITQQGFLSDLTSLINCYSMENGSDTPDFVLAQYLTACLTTFDRTVRLRDGYRNPEGGNCPLSPGIGDLLTGEMTDRVLTDVETHH